MPRAAVAEVPSDATGGVTFLGSAVDEIIRAVALQGFLAGT